MMYTILMLFSCIYYDNIDIVLNTANLIRSHPTLHSVCLLIESKKPEKKKLNQEEKDQGVEMTQDFDGEMFDVPSDEEEDQQSDDDGKYRLLACFLCYLVLCTLFLLFTFCYNILDIYMLSYALYTLTYYNPLFE